VRVTAQEGEAVAIVSRVIELTSVSEKSFDDAVDAALERARQTLRGLHSATITSQQVLLGRDGHPEGYKVTMAVDFVLDGQVVVDWAPYPDAATQLADFASIDDDRS
jgi:flavin-binding protein dodecin